VYIFFLKMMRCIQNSCEKVKVYGFYQNGGNDKNFIIPAVL
jgi:hypothetical protein